MRRSPLLPILFPILLLSCKESPEKRAVPGTDSAVTPDTITSTDPSVPEGQAPNATDTVAEDFDRIPESRIDSALMTYAGGDTVSIDSIGQNECIDQRLNRYVLRNGLVLEGNTYSMYATNWLFQGSFTPVLGLARGMSAAETERVLGRPHTRRTDSLFYKSERFRGPEAEIFECRWNLLIRFEADKLKSLRFTPMFDDC